MQVSRTVLGRTLVTAACAIAVSGCANEPKLAPSLNPMMMVGGPAAAATASTDDLGHGSHTVPPDSLAHKSQAAKVLAARALEIVTGLKTDPARLSEHD